MWRIHVRISSIFPSLFLSETTDGQLERDSLDPMSHLLQDVLERYRWQESYGVCFLEFFGDVTDHASRRLKVGVVWYVWN